MKRRIVKVNRAMLKAACEISGLSPRQMVERAIELATRPRVFVSHAYPCDSAVRTYLETMLRGVGCIYVDADSGPRQ